MHQESEYNDITDDDIYQKNKKKKTNKKNDWSDKALEDFLETLREQPVKEMNDRRNKWIMFSKCLEMKTAPERRIHAACPTVPRDAVLPPICMAAETGIYKFTINSLEDVKGVWGMHTGGNPESATAIAHKITLFLQLENFYNS